MLNILDVVAADKNLTSMMKGVKAAGLETQMNQPGPYTVFAPIEIAFGKLATGVFTDLLKPENKIELTGILNSHVVEGKTNFKEFTDGQKLTTINGKELDIKVLNGQVTVNGAAILGRDSDASNGVVHSIDKIIPVN